jgi:hypothetical protein
MQIRATFGGYLDRQIWLATQPQHLEKPGIIYFFPFKENYCLVPPRENDLKEQKRSRQRTAGSSRGPGTPDSALVTTLLNTHKRINLNNLISTGLIETQARALISVLPQIRHK